MMTPRDSAFQTPGERMILAMGFSISVVLLVFILVFYMTPKHIYETLWL